MPTQQVKDSETCWPPDTTRCANQTMYWDSNGFAIVNGINCWWYKSIAGLRLSDKQQANVITLCTVLKIVDRHSGDTYIISYTAEIDIDGVIDIFERLIKPTVGLPLSIVPDQDALYM